MTMTIHTYLCICLLALGLGPPPARLGHERGQARLGQLFDDASLLSSMHNSLTREIPDTGDPMSMIEYSNIIILLLYYNIIRI